MAAKIKDGLFIGDGDSAGDAEFLDLNKIVNLVNLAGRELPNRFSGHGLVYLSINWQDHPDCVLFDSTLGAVVDIVSFIDDSLHHGQSVLLFSTRGVGRCAVAACVYLMYKYRWGFEKSYDYVVSKKPDIDINRGFVHQLFQLDKRLTQIRKSLPAGSCVLSGPTLVPGTPLAGRAPALQLPGFAMISASMEAEMMRREGWNPAYVTADGDLNGNLPPQLQRVHDEVGDEVLLIYSYLNSKNTISSVPGPYPEALRQPRSFTIRFNPDLFLNHLYEEPGGRFVSMSSLSSGKPHPPPPLSPSQSKNHLPNGVLKGGRLHRSNLGLRGPSEIKPQNNRHSVSGAFDSPPRAPSHLASHGWASPEQRLHEILDDLSNINNSGQANGAIISKAASEDIGSPHYAVASNNKHNREESDNEPRRGNYDKGRRKNLRRRTGSGELTDTDDEEESFQGLVKIIITAVAESKLSFQSSKGSKEEGHKGSRRDESNWDRQLSEGKAPSGGCIADVHSDLGASSMKPNLHGDDVLSFNKEHVKDRVNAVTGAKHPQSPNMSLYDLANIQVDPSYQGDTMDSNEEQFSGPRAQQHAWLPAGTTSMPKKFSTLERKLDHEEKKSAGSSEVKRGYNSTEPSGTRYMGVNTSAALVGAPSDSMIQSSLMSTGIGTVLLEQEDGDMYYSNYEEEGLPATAAMDSISQSLMRAQQLSEDARGRTAKAFAQQQQQDELRQRQKHRQSYASSVASRVVSEPPITNPPREAWSSSMGNRVSSAAAAVAAAEAMATHRPRHQSSGTGGSVRASHSMRFETGGATRLDVGNDARRPVSKTQKPDWAVGTTGSLDSATTNNSSGGDAIGPRTPKLYRHGSPAPRVSSSSRLSKDTRGSTSSLRRDSLGRESLGLADQSSVATGRSSVTRESTVRASVDTTYTSRRPSPSPYERRSSSEAAGKTLRQGTPTGRTSTPVGKKTSSGSSSSAGWRF